ncbi:MAG: NADPH:quinone oxidoreductase family protein [Oleiphilaceae bacterium]|nr:NADPH:quinone oxidoreductase family protein [Oleiphilaceae bacterium]
MAVIEPISNPRCAQISQFAEDPVKGVEKNLHLVSQVKPNVQDLVSHDVLIQVKAAALGWVDLLMTSGQYQHMPPLPYTPGLEYSGVIEWAGKEAKAEGLSIGDRVFVDGFVTGPRSPGKYQQYGGFANYAVAPAEAVRAIPEGFSFEQACNLLGSYETAYHCLVKCGELKPGETVLIHGASGATGLAAVHMAKLLGAKVIATGRSDEKLAVVKEQGADWVINTSSSDPDFGVSRFRDEVKALTNGAGVDVVYDGVGGDISLESMRCVKFGARFLIVGWASTPFVAKGKGQRGAPNANMLPTNLIMMKGLKVLGCPTVISAQQDPSIRQERLSQIMSWVRNGDIQPFVSSVYDLENVKQAMKDKWTGKIIGGAVLKPE